MKTFGEYDGGRKLPYYLRNRTVDVGDILLWEDDILDIDDDIMTIIKSTAKSFGVTVEISNGSLVVTNVE